MKQLFALMQDIAPSACLAGRDFPLIDREIGSLYSNRGRQIVICVSIRFLELLLELQVLFHFMRAFI